jgi:hypothetical protein
MGIQNVIPLTVLIQSSYLEKEGFAPFIYIYIYIYIYILIKVPCLFVLT